MTRFPVSGFFCQPGRAACLADHSGPLGVVSGDRAGGSAPRRDPRPAPRHAAPWGVAAHPDGAPGGGRAVRAIP